jgi:hypothetical protein
MILLNESPGQLWGERIYLINLDDEVMVKRVEWLGQLSNFSRRQYSRLQRIGPASKDPGKLNILVRLMWMRSKI